MNAKRWLIGVFAILAGAAAAGPFDTWNYQAKITFSGYNPPGGATTLTNFPALVALRTSIPNFDYSKFLSLTNQDLRFTDSSKNVELNYEIDSWNTSGTSYVWVQVPTITTTNDFIYAYWGKANANAPAYTTNGATWSNGYVAVWHFNETGNVHHDSAGVVDNFVTNCGAVTYVSTGMVAGAWQFAGGSGGNDYMRTADNAAELDSMTSLTMEGWFFSSNNSGVRAMLGKRSSAQSDTSYTMFHNAGVWNSDLGTGYRPTGPSPSLNQWHYEVVSFAPGYAGSCFFLDNQVATYLATNARTIGPQSCPTCIGRIAGNTGTWLGMIDEVRLSNVSRSTNWLWATYETIASNATFQTYAANFQDQTIPQISVLAATNIAPNSAYLNATLMSTGTSATAVWVYWGTNSGGTNAVSWANTNSFGVNGLAPPVGYSFQATGLTVGGTYVYRYFAQNASGGVWSADSPVFTTVGPPSVVNVNPAGILASAATLGGQVTGGYPGPQAYICWGTSNPGVSSTGAWQAATAMGVQSGSFATNIVGLVPNTAYFYRCYATNSQGDAWAPTVATFTTAVYDSYTWTGSGADVNWTTPNNWDVGGITPTTSVSRALFNAPAPRLPTLNQGFPLLQLDVVGSTNWIWSGPATATVNNAFTYGSSGTSTFSAVMAGSGGLTVTNGSLTMGSAANSFTGDVWVKGGVLIASGAITNGGPSYLGAGTNAILIGDTSGSAYAELQISANASTSYRNVTVVSGGTGQATLHLNSSGTGGSTFGAIGQQTVAMNKDLYVLSDGNSGMACVLNSLVTGTGSLYKAASIAITVMGNTNNTYTGKTILLGGTLKVSSASSTISTNGGTLGLPAAGNEEVLFGDTAGTNSVTLTGDNGSCSFNRPLRVRAGSTGAATLTYGSSGGSWVFNGNITLERDLTLTGPSSLINGLLVGSGSGTSRVIMASAANTWTYSNNVNPTITGGALCQLGTLRWQRSDYAGDTSIRFGIAPDSSPAPVVLDGGDFELYSAYASGGGNVTLVNPVTVTTNGGRLAGFVGTSTRSTNCFSGTINLGGRLTVGTINNNSQGSATNRYLNPVVINHSTGAVCELIYGQYNGSSSRSRFEGNVTDASGSAANVLAIRGNGTFPVSGTNHTHKNGTIVEGDNGLIDVTAATGTFGSGPVYVQEGGRLRVTDAARLPAAGIKVYANDTALGVLALGSDAFPSTLAGDSAGIIALDTGAANFTSFSSLAALGNGRMFMGSYGGGQYGGATLAPCSDGIYRLGGGGGTLTIANGVLAGAANSVQVGAKCAGNNSTIGTGFSSGYGTVKLLAANTYGSGTIVYANSTLDGTAQSSGSPFGATNGPVLLAGGALQVDGVANATTTSVGQLTMSGCGLLYANQPTAPYPATTLRVDSLAARSAATPNVLLLTYATSVTNLGGRGRVVIVNGAPSPTNGIVSPRYLVQDSSYNPDFVTYNTNSDAFGTIGFQAATNQYTIVTGDGTFPNSATALASVTATFGLTSSREVYSLKVGNYSITNAAGVNTITVDSGGVICNNQGATIAPNLTLGGEGIIYVGVAGKSTTLSGTLTGANGLTKVGPGTLVLGADNSATLSGTIAVLNGILQYSADTQLGAPGNPIYLDGGDLWAAPVATLTRPIALGPSGGSFDVGSNGQELNISGAITGSGALSHVMAAQGHLKLTSSGNTYSGGTVVSGNREMVVAANSSLGIGDVSVGNAGILSLWGNAAIGGGDTTTTNDDRAARLTIMSGGVVNFYGAAPTIGSLSGGGTLSLSNTVLTIGNDNSSTIWNGAINQMAGTTGSVVKVGSGTLTIKGWSRYLGSTTVNGGTLVADASMAGSVTVATGATLTGCGILAGTLTNNGTLSAGATNTVGQLTLGGLTLSSNSAFWVSVNGPNIFGSSTAAVSSNSYDQVVVNGAASLNNALLQVVLGYAPTSSDNFVILHTTGGIAGQFTQAGAALGNGAVVDCGVYNANHYYGTLLCGAYDVVLTNVAQLAGSPVIVNGAATSVQTTSASMNGTLNSAGGTQPAVALYWGTSNGSNSPAAWAYTNSFGTNTAPCPVSYSTNMTGLTPDTSYYYTYYASNSTGGSWPIGSASFKTYSPPVVNNTGVMGLGPTYATLYGSLVTTGSSPTTVTIYWGTDSNNLVNSSYLGYWGTNAFSYTVTNLFYGNQYYYQCVVSNAWGLTNTSPVNFVTPRPAGAAISLTNLAAAGVTTNTATLMAALACSGATYTVTAYCNTNNGGTNAMAWGIALPVGSYANLVSTNLACPAGSLVPNTAYYFTFRATNALEDLWATNVTSFQTYGAPAVNNCGGATNVLSAAATLQGQVTAGNPIPLVYSCWGTNTPGDSANTGAWATVAAMGSQSNAFSTNLTGLAASTTYYYRNFATNAWGGTWSDVTNFTTLGASTYVWDGGAGDVNWTSPLNWDKNLTYPNSPMDQAVFNTAAPRQPTINTGVSVGNLTVVGSTNWTWSGTATATVNNVFAYGSSGTSTFSAVMAGSGGLTVTNGSLTMGSAANSFTGDVWVKGGVLIAAGAVTNGGPSYLGAGTNAILIGDTAGSANSELQIAANSATSYRNVTVVSGGTGQATLHLNSGGSGAATFGALGQQTFTLNKDLTVLSDGNSGQACILNGLVTGTGSLYKAGTISPLTLGNTNNNYTGKTILLAGILKVSSATSTISTNGGTLGVPAVGNEEVLLGDTTGTNSVTLAGDVGTCAFNRPLRVRAGSTGTATLKYGTSSGSWVFNGNVTLERDVTLAGFGSIINGLLVGSGSGTSRVIMADANTTWAYSNNVNPTINGGALVQAGTLRWQRGDYAGDTTIRFGTAADTTPARITLDGGDFELYTAYASGGGNVILESPVTVTTNGGRLAGYIATTARSTNCFGGTITLGGRLTVGTINNNSVTAATNRYQNPVILNQSAGAVCEMAYAQYNSTAHFEGNVSDGAGLAANVFAIRGNATFPVSGTGHTHKNGTIIEGDNGLIDVTAASGTLGSGPVHVQEGGRLRVNGAARLPAGVPVKLYANGTALGVLALGSDSFPSTLAGDSAGIIAVDTGVANFMSFNNLASLGNGRMFMGSYGGGQYGGSSLAPCSDGIYRLGGGGGTLTIANGVLAGSANSVQVGAPCAGNNNSIGTTFSGGYGTVKLLAANTYGSGTVVYANSTLDGTAQTAGSPFGATNAPVVLADGILQVDGIANAATTSVGQLTVYGYGVLYANQTTTPYPATALRVDSLAPRNASTPNVLLLNVNGTTVSNLGARCRVVLANGAPALTNGIVAPRYLVQSDMTVSCRPDFATYNSTSDAGGTIGFLAATSLYTTVTSDGTFPDSATALVNVTASLGLTSSRQVFGLKVGSYSITNAAGPTTITVGSGGVLCNTSGSTIAPNLTLGDEGIVYVGWGGKTLTLSGTLAGNNGLTKVGPGNLVLSTDNSLTLTGTIAVLNGALQCSADNQLGAPGNPLYLDGGILVVSSVTGGTLNRNIVLGPSGGAFDAGSNGKLLTLNGAITGSGAFTHWVASQGSITLTSPNNTFSGGAVATGSRVLAVAANSSLGTGDVTLDNNGLVYLYGDKNIGGGDTTTLADDRQARLTIYAGGTLYWQSPSPSIGSLSGAGTLVLGAPGTNTVLTVGGDNSSTIWNGSINQDPAATGSVVKVGSGTLTLKGWSRYSGPTTVASGTLVADASMAGSVTVANGAALGGNGFLAGTLTNNGTLSAGTTNTVGLLTVGSLTLAGNSTFLVNLNATNAYDQVLVNGPAVLNNAALQVVLGYAPSPSDSFTILQAGSVSGQFAQGTTVDCGMFAGSHYYGTVLYGSGSVTLTNLAVRPAIANLAATTILTTSAFMNGSLTSTGTAATAVTLYWGPTDGTTNVAGWANAVSFGINAAGPMLYSTNMTALTPDTTYWYTYSASNVAGFVWGQTSSTTFKTYSAPVLDNGVGATNLGPTFATLSGYLYTTGSSPTRVTIHWGTDSNNWANSMDLGYLGAGPFAITVTNLYFGPRYYYNCFATNAWGSMSTAPLNFVTPRPGGAGGSVISLADATANNIQDTSATLNASLACSGATYSVTAYWNTINAGTNAAAWGSATPVGGYTNLVSTGLTCQAGGLTPNMTYYFTFRAVNASEDLWATNVLTFVTYGPPQVSNGTGPTGSITGETVSGQILADGGSPASAFICWGLSDPGTTVSNDWQHVVTMGLQSGAFATSLTELQPRQVYWYRCFATNIWGSGWAPASTNFMTPDRAHGTTFSFR